MLKKLIIALLLPVFFQAATNSGSTGSAFLKINTGARSGALGGAYTGLAEDNDGIFFNPAGLAQGNVPELSGGDIIWLADTSLQHAEFFLPVSKDIYLGINGIYMNSGTFDAYTSAGVAAGNFSAYDVSAGLTIAVKFSPTFMAGVTGKYIVNNIASDTSKSYALDAGVLLKEIMPGISFGASVNNLGTPVNFGTANESLPLAARAGFALYPSSEAIITLDGLMHPFEGDISLCAGMELYAYEEYIVVRVGYNYPLNTRVVDFASGFSAGLGVTVSPVTINYSLIPAEIGYTHRVAVSLLFGEKTKKIKTFEAVSQMNTPIVAVSTPAPLAPVVNETTAEKPIILPGTAEVKTGPKVVILKPFISKTLKESQRNVMFEIIKSNLVNSKHISTLFSESDGVIPEELNAVVVITGGMEKKGEMIEITAALNSPQGKELTVFKSEAKSLIDTHMKSNELSKKIEQYIQKYVGEIDAKRLKIAVMDLVPKSVTKEKADIVSDFIRTEMSNNSNIIVVERANIDKIVKEQMLQASGCTDSDCAVELGKILNVEKIIVGSVSSVDKKIYISVRLVDVETAHSVFGKSKEIDNETQLFNTCRELAKEINSSITYVK